MKRRTSILALLIGAVSTCVIAADPSYPTKPIRLIVNDTAGGPATDAGARYIAQRLEKALGQPIVLENRPGASGIIAAQAVAQAEGDGYTLLYTLSDPIVLNPLTFKKLPYDPQKDLKVIAHIQKRVTTLMVSTTLPSRTLAELIDYAKSHPGKLSFASFGVGTQTHIAGEYLNRQAGIDILHVPYKSTAAWVPDMMAGRLPVAFGPPSLAKSLAESGKVRVLAVTGTARSPLLPDIPTFAEAGLPSLGLLVSWQSILAPAGTPEYVLRRINAEVTRIVSSAEASDRIVNVFGGEPAKSDLDEAARIFVDDRMRWQKTLDILGNIPLN